MSVASPEAARAPDPGKLGAGPAGVAVLVLGPEGAGPESVAGLLGLLGCDLPRGLAGAGPREARGAWEAATGLSWADPADPAQARAALDAAFGPAPLPLLGGAALARALPTWLAALDGTGRAAVAVLAFDLPVGDADGEAWDRWTRDALRAERSSRDLRRAVCGRDRLLADWRGEADRLASELSLAWPARTAGEASADAFAASARAALAGSSPPAPPGHPARTLAEVLARWSQAGEDPADRPDLDRIAHELGPANEVWAEGAGARPVKAATPLPGSKRSRPDGMAEAQARWAEAAGSASVEGGPDDRRAALEAELAALRHERDQTASALRQRSHEADEQARARAAAEAALAEARAEHAADLRRMDRLRRDVAVLKRDALGELGARLAGLAAAAPRGDRSADEAAAPREAVAGFGEPQDLAWRLAEAERRAENRRAEGEGLAARLRDAERQARQAQELADAAQAEVEMLRRSSSWRLTAPLRSVVRVLRRG